MNRSITMLALAAILASPVASQSFVRITTPVDDTIGVSNIQEPILVEGLCSADIVEIRIVYYFSTRNRSDKADGAPLEQVESYALTKYVPGSGRFLYRIFPSLGNLGCGTNLYVVEGRTDRGEQCQDDVTVMSSQYFGERAKPVIYLYPKAESRVSVDVRPLEGVSVSEPPLGSGWSVIARPDGRITNLADGKDYPYLYWESPDSSPPFSHTEGFVVARADLAQFFRDTLADAGLSASEIADFIDYWIDALAVHPWYQFYFVPRDRLDREAPLSVSPAPDTVIRVFFDYRGLEEPVAVTPQTLSAPERKGFVVVEWGGRKYTR